MWVWKLDLFTRPLMERTEHSPPQYHHWRSLYQILTRQTRQWVSLRWTKWRLSKESFICKLFMERKQIVCRHVIRIQYCTAANVLYMKTSVSPPSSRGPWRTCSSGRSSAWSCTWAGCYSSLLHDFETRSFCTFSKFDFTGTETHLLSEVEIYLTPASLFLLRPL